MNRSSTRLTAIIVFAVAPLLVARAGLADLIVFSTDFESGIPSEMSGPFSIAGVQGFAGIGNAGNTFSGNFLQNSAAANQPTILELSGLPDHTHLNLNFLLAILESWDGSADVPGAAPDLFNVSVDGVTIFSESFETTDVSPQSYVPPAGVELVHKINLGNWGHGFPESGYDMGFDPVFQNIAHSSDTLTIEWFASGSGWQGGADESWAIDNLSISLAGGAVPEPGCALLGLAGILIAASRRRRLRLCAVAF